MTAAVELDVIVPCLDEGAIAQSLAERLRHLADDARVRVIVADGGSQDETLDTLQRAGVEIIRCKRGRALQMNGGARRGTAAYILFLHADTQIPQTALDALFQVIGIGAHWGRFDVRIVGQSRWLPMVEFMMNWRSRITGIATGDQGLFVQRSLFEQVGGFPEQPLMEDVELSSRLLRHIRPVCLRDKLQTSGRRWDQNGVWRTIWLMWRLRFEYWRGASPESLAARYV